MKLINTILKILFILLKNININHLRNPMVNLIQTINDQEIKI